MMASLAKMAVAATSILSILSTAEAQTGLQQPVYQGCYSTAAPMYTNSSLTWQFQTPGWCQENCGNYAQMPAFAVTKGSDCWCGEKLPPTSAKVDDTECNRPCQGYGQQMCGGMTTFSVYTSGLTTSVDTASDSEASSAATASGTSGTKPSAVQSTITQAGQTIVVTATSTSSAQASEPKGSGGPSKAGIAAGVVVGLVVLAGIIGGACFFIRQKKRREIEEEHQRQQTINGIGRSGFGTMKSEHSSADSRLDPTMMYRRQSDGSIHDEINPSSRVLKVTNPDRNTMIA